MKKFIRYSAIFFSPVFVWILIVIILDPFNYFNWKYSLFSATKKENAEKLNPLIYATIECINNPNEYVLIGDSRTRALPQNEILKISGKNYLKLSTNAAKLNEIFDMIYFANSKRKLKHVVIGINFNQFNKYGFADRISNIKEMIDNPAMYIFNRNIIEANFYLVKYALFGGGIKATPKFRKEFWKWNIDIKAAEWYSKYKFPDQLYSDLFKLDSFSVANNITLTLIIVPHFREFHDRLIEFKLAEEEQRFKKILSNLSSEVIDYDYDNIITSDSSNFFDPIHYNKNIGRLIVNEVWSKQYKIGKVISKNRYSQ